MIDKHMLQNKRVIQGYLANDYGEAARRKKMNKYQEKVNNLSADRVTNQRIKQELDFIGASEAKKKRYIQEIFRNEKKLSDLAKQNEKRKQNEVLREDQNLLHQTIKDSYDREAIFKSRYRNFQEFQNKAANSFKK